MDLRLTNQDADGGRARGGRRRARRRRRSAWVGGDAAEPTATSPAAATPRGRSAICCCRCSTPCRAASAGSARRARLRLPAADGPAGRGLRRGELLRAVRARAAAAGRRARVHRHRLHVPRRRRAGRRARAHGRAGRRAPRERLGDLAREPLPGPVRAGAGGAGHPGRRGAAASTRSRRPRAADVVGGAGRQRTPEPAAPTLVPQAGDGATACGCCAASARVDPASLDSYRARGGYEALRARVRHGAGRA